MFLLMQEKVEKVIDRHCLMVSIAIAQGADTEMPDSFEMMEEWIDGLSKPPESIEDPERYAYLKAVGLRP